MKGTAMRKRLSTILLVCTLAACASTSLLTAETQALETVTTARQVSTAALRAGTITVAQDQSNQAKLDLVRASIVAAKAAGDAQQLAKAKAAAEAVKNQPGATAP